MGQQENGVQKTDDFNHFAIHVEQQHGSNSEQIRITNFLTGLFEPQSEQF